MATNEVCTLFLCFLDVMNAWKATFKNYGTSTEN